MNTKITAKEPPIRHRFFTVQSLDGQIRVCDVLRKMAPLKCHNWPTALFERDRLNRQHGDVAWAQG